MTEIMRAFCVFIVSMIIIPLIALVILRLWYDALDGIGTTIVVGRKSLYRCGYTAPAFLGDLFDPLMNGPSRLSLLIGNRVAFLKKKDLENRLTPDELFRVREHLNFSERARICIARDNEVAAKVIHFWQTQ
jgi:hypothetical protein